MSLSELLNAPELHAGSRLPWGDEVFSQRMLQEYLDASHDLASRRPTTIDVHVDWLASSIPTGARVLDLGCGPGLYAKRLADRGHDCVGIDISPAAIAYAQAHAARALHRAGSARCGPIDAFFAVTADATKLGKATGQTSRPATGESAKDLAKRISVQARNSRVRTGLVARSGADNPAVGDPNRTETLVDVASDELLVLDTDGLVERRDEARSWTHAPRGVAVAKCREPVQTVVERLIADLVGEKEDDIALIVKRIR